MTGIEILNSMDNGFTIHGSFLGFWLQNPIDNRVHNVHNGAVKSLIRKGLIKKYGEQYVKSQLCKGDKCQYQHLIVTVENFCGRFIEICHDQENGGTMLVLPNKLTKIQ
jgi:hypothetical protein